MINDSGLLFCATLYCGSLHSDNLYLHHSVIFYCRVIQSTLIYNILWVCLPCYRPMRYNFCSHFYADFLGRGEGGKKVDCLMGRKRVRYLCWGDRFETGENEILSTQSARMTELVPWHLDVRPNILATKKRHWFHLPAREIGHPVQCTHIAR